MPPLCVWLCRYGNSDFRLLKKLQMQDVEERGMRHTLLYAAMTSDADNDADGLFQLPEAYQTPVVRYSCIESAAFLPSPIASMTVAPPLTMSPPEKTPFLLVLPVSWSTVMLPHLFTLISGVVWGMSGFAPLPMATMATSHSMVNSEPFISTGLLLPDSSGEPSSILTHSTALSLPSSSPMNLLGLVRSWSLSPSCSPW